MKHRNKPSARCLSLHKQLELAPQVSSIAAKHTRACACKLSSAELQPCLTASLEACDTYLQALHSIDGSSTSFSFDALYTELLQSPRDSYAVYTRDEDLHAPLACNLVHCHQRLGGDSGLARQRQESRLRRSKGHALEYHCLAVGQDTGRHQVHQVTADPPWSLPSY